MRKDNVYKIERNNINKDICDCHPVVRPKVCIAVNAGKTISINLTIKENMGLIQYRGH